MKAIMLDGFRKKSKRTGGGWMIILVGILTMAIYGFLVQTEFTLALMRNQKSLLVWLRTTDIPDRPLPAQPSESLLSEKSPIERSSTPEQPPDPDE